MPIRTWEEYWALFDDNLPEIGLLAVWVELRNTRPQEIDLSGVKWELQRGPESFHAADLGQVFKQYYKRHDVRLYSLNADNDARQAMSLWLLHTSRLRPEESQKGFLFFRLNSYQPPDWNRGTVLFARGFPGDAGERRARRNLELPLFHANP